MKFSQKTLILGAILVIFVAYDISNIYVMHSFEKPFQMKFQLYVASRFHYLVLYFLNLFFINQKALKISFRIKISFLENFNLVNEYSALRDAVVRTYLYF